MARSKPISSNQKVIPEPHTGMSPFSDTEYPETADYSTRNNETREGSQSSRFSSQSTSPQAQDLQVRAPSQRIRGSKSKPVCNQDAPNSNDVDPLDMDGSVIPPLSPVVIKNVVAINDALIKVCQEFQNKNWTNEPDYAIYQRRLQSNLTYLSTVADFYLNPDRPNDSSAPLDLTPFPPSNIRSAKVLNNLLTQANSTFRSKTGAIDPRLNLNDKVAAVRAAASMANEAKPGATKVDPKAPNPSPHDVYSAHKVYDPPASECGLDSYVPFPAFRLPSEIKLPFES
ncbi:hypothetical protein DSO57_1009458 [Entomophthora muscae]|uniref:Uncharacterized protein n=2 Tax=Entomophthora muscae TaxID=34485 RepID=A0ACC2SBJ6_9FUNG|nr:hypothetical protein DSO57_1039049 [Entomophthora muscae]KAJ9074133.1 hypothetical protein DSO57_1009458 [Entomophthora muscae]